MKILLFIDSLGAGGAQRQLVGLATMLYQQEFDVKVCTYHNLDFYKHVLDENGVPNELIQGASSSLKRIPAIRNYFKKESPDYVIAYQETPSLVASAVKVLGCNYKLIVSERNTTQELCINERVRFFLYHWADSIVPNSFTQGKFLADKYPWMKSKLKVISNFVDLNKFSYIEKIRSDVPSILVVGSLRESKNARGLIKACKILKDQDVKFFVKWFGINSDDITEYQKETFSLAEELGVDDVIKFFHKLKTIETEYKQTDYFCLPSFFEGTPNVICEAISTGVPVMCSDVCDNSMYVQNGNNGVLFNPKDPLDIAAKIKALLSQSDNQYLAFRRASRKNAEELLSMESFINKYIEILK